MTDKTNPKRRRLTAKSKATGPQTLTGSRAAKRQAVVLLGVLSGLRGPEEGSEALEVSLNRYYQLETRGLQGLISALEPRPKGRQRTPEGELEQLRQEKERLSHQLSRNQALLRATQRSLGLPRSRSAETNSGRVGGKGKTNKKTRRRSRTVRATKAIAVLRQAVATETPVTHSAVGASS